MNGFTHEVQAADLRNGATNTISACFAAVAALHRDEIAVCDATARWTYGQLAQAANAIAAVITARHGSSNSPVAILLDAGAEAAGVLLGVLATGRATVPLDPHIPAGRLTYILQDTRAAILVTNRTFAAQAAELITPGCQLMLLEEIDLSGEKQPLERSPAPDDTAWILYTSGSTGQPKGVMQSHRNILAYADTYARGLPVGPGDQVLNHFSLNANFGNHVTYMALLSGATLHYVSLHGRAPTLLPSYLAEHAITIWSTVPTVLDALDDGHAARFDLPALHTLMLIGEPVYRRHFDSYCRLLPTSCRFINRYGSSETGTVCWRVFDHHSEFEGNNVPIGRATPNHELLIVDEKGQALPAGSRGEIAVRSPYLFAGYLRMSTKTAQALDHAPGELPIYRSGDVGILQADGEAVHLGRLDSQVKIRGHRVEPGEIEHALLKHPSVKSVLVKPFGDNNGGIRLAAYYVRSGLTDDAVDPGAEGLRQFLAASLPPYMIPPRFIRLDEMPLAANGKINRSALPEPAKLRPDLQTPFAAPQTPVEQAVANVWCEILDIDSVGVDDDFFALGGDSISALRIIAGVIDVLHLEVRVEELLTARTIRMMSIIIVAHQLGQYSSPVRR